MLTPCKFRGNFSALLEPIEHLPLLFRCCGYQIPAVPRINFQCCLTLHPPMKVYCIKKAATKLMVTAFLFPKALHNTPHKVVLSDILVCFDSLFIVVYCVYM